MTFEYYRKTLLSLVGAPYLYGGECRKGCDCSGLLRAVFSLPFNADQFYHRLFTEVEGELGAVFYVNSCDVAFHVMPIVGYGVCVDASRDGVVLRQCPPGEIWRYI